jgi:FkbM family methyltransferase
LIRSAKLKILRRLIFTLAVKVLQSSLFYWVSSQVALGPKYLLWDPLNKKEKLAFIFFCISHRLESESQIGQDLWVLFRCGEQKNGFFVEVGACYPKKLSNTYLLEKQYNWQGVLVEPNPELAAALLTERSALLVPVLVSNDNKAEYVIATEPEYSSTLSQLSQNRHREFQQTEKKSHIKVMSLNKVLEMSNVPRDFDFLSIDIEGGEYEAIKTLDLSQWKPSFISVEHNFHSDRKLINKILCASGYVLDPLCPKWSWDDWYIRSEILRSSE